MRELVLEIAVAAMLVVLGIGAAWLITGERALQMDLDLAYYLGALVFSVPAIVIFEWRRRRRQR